MPSRTTRHSHTHQRPAFLNAESDEEALDRPIREDEFALVWRCYEPFVRTGVRRALRGVSLHLAEKAAAACPEARHLLASPGAVRSALMQDEDLVDDLVQDVAIVLANHVRDGAVPAAAPVVEAFLTTTVRFVVKAGVVRPGTHRFGSGVDIDETDESQLGLGEAVSRFPSPWEFAVASEITDSLRKQLNEREIAVLDARADGYRYNEIGDGIRLTAEGARSIMFRIRKLLVTREMCTPLSGRRRRPKGSVPPAFTATTLDKY